MTLFLQKFLVNPDWKYNQNLGAHMPAPREPLFWTTQQQKVNLN